jgi:predicted metal-dependent enzyme (double-stranded beta helix superfamily)
MGQVLILLSIYCRGDLMGIGETRSDVVRSTIERIRVAVVKMPLERAALDNVLTELRGLAARGEFWSPDTYPVPGAETRQARYLIQEDPDHSFALYLNVMLPGRRIPPHNHTTWACVAGVEGEEHNFVYRRLDDRTEPGHAELELSDLVVVGPGTGIALMPDDIHSVEIRGDKPIRHLHIYGRALETLTERSTFDLEAKTERPMTIGVQTRR